VSEDLGNLYIDNYGNPVVRRVNPTGGTLVLPPTTDGTTSAAKTVELRLNSGSLSQCATVAPVSGVALAVGSTARHKRRLRSMGRVWPRCSPRCPTASDGF